MNTFCPDGRKIFKRLNFRDYFLSFVLPMDDDLFDDEDLDSCQIYDFVKDAEKREREDEERKQEEERRRRIDDDEDYEEELTTIVNNMEDDSEVYITSTMPTESTTSSELESESTTTFSMPVTPPILGTLGSLKPEDFTTILDELITSSETGKSEEIDTSEDHLEKEQNEHDDLDSLVNNLDEETDGEKVRKKEDQEESHDTTQLPTPSTAIPQNPESSQNEPKTEDDPDHNTEYHDYTEPHYDEEYHDDGNENTTHPTISVVSIETRLSASDSEEMKTSSEEQDELVEVTTPDQILHLTPPNTVDDESREIVLIETTTGKRKVFSEDSMENTPPNFYYSSNRYDSTTRSNYVADNLDLQDSEEPLEIDTSTLFGVETTSAEDSSTEFIAPVETTVSPKRVEGKSKPWLHGGVIVKPILNFDQLDVDQDEERQREERRKQEAKASSNPSSASSPSDPTSPPADEDDDDFLSGSDSPSTNETLIVIGLIALVTCLIFLILLLLLAYFCSTRTDNYNVHKNEGSPSV